MFYLSNYLEQNRGEYYARLKAISAEGDWTGWIAFYLKAVVEQAKLNNIKIRLILKLYDETKEKIRTVTRFQHTMQLLDAFFMRPVFKITELGERINMPKPTAHKLIGQLEKEKILLKLREGSGRRSATYAFPELLNIVEGRQVFRNKVEGHC